MGPTFAKVGIGIMAFITGIWWLSKEKGTEISYNQFITDIVQKNMAEKIEIVNGSKVRVYLNVGSVDDKSPIYFFYIPSLEAFENKLANLKEEFPQIGEMNLKYSREFDALNFLADYIGIFGLVGLMGFSIYMASRRFKKDMKGRFGMFPDGGAKRFKKTKSNIKFNEVAGCDEAKVEIMEFVQFLKNPKKYEDLGAKMPKGALLVGPPGTGKTLLAKATAGEAGVPFYSVAGSDFQELFVGVGSSRVRELFAEARKNAPSIVFIDEIDSIGLKRSSRVSNDERESTLNQLLVEMDGFTTSKNPVIVLAGTNRHDQLDKALLRPGRFDRIIALDLPDIKARKEILMIHLKKLKLQESLENYSNHVAAMTPGFSGADLANICNEAALIAARWGDSSISMKHFEAAIERVIAGLERKTLPLSHNEKKTVAFHEAGHAVVSWFLKNGSPLLKVSIIPRGPGLGYAMYIPEEHNLYTSDKLMDMVAVALGGRAAEEVVFNTITTGASDDLQKVTRIIYGRLLEYGMSETIGPSSFGSLSRQSYSNKPYSEETAAMIDREARIVVQRAYETAKKIIRDNYESFEKLANLLYEKEVLSYDDCREILGDRPYPPSKSHEEFLKYHLTKKNIQSTLNAIKEEKISEVKPSKETNEHKDTTEESNENEKQESDKPTIDESKQNEKMDENIEPEKMVENSEPKKEDK